MAVVILLLTLLVALVVIKYLMDTVKLKNYPPGPPRYPVIGSLPHIPGTLIHLHGEKHWRHKYGPLVGLRPGSRTMVLVCGAEEVFTVLNHEHCQTRPSGHAFRERSFGKAIGLMFSDGDFWKSQRRFTLRELRDLGLGKSKLEGVVLDEVDATLDAIRRDGPEIEPNKMFNSPVLNVLWWMVSGKPFARVGGAGKTLDPQSRRLLDIMNRSMRNKSLGTAPCDLWPFLKYIAPDMSRYNEIYQPIFDMQAFIKEEMKSQRQSGNCESYMGKYTEEIAKASAGFTDEGLIVACFDLFVAGGESTANTLSFALMYMAMHTDVQARVHEELDRVCGGAGNVITLSHRASLPLLEATLAEVMRINTIAPLTVPHEASRDVEINGYTIPKGTILLVSMWSVLNDKKHWGDPEVFRPERFLDKEGKYVKDPYMVQFGVGKRLCIGEAFAMQVAFLFFANMMNKFKFLLPPGSSRPSEIPDPGFTVAPQPFSVIATPRS